MEGAKLLLLLYQKLVRKRKKQDGKQNKRYDINSCSVNHANGKRYLWYKSGKTTKEKKEKRW
jgi:hypothetical protein